MKSIKILSLMGLALSAGALCASTKQVDNCAAEVSDAGFLRIAFYYPDKVLEGSFAFKDRVEELKRDMEKRNTKLRDARRELQNRYQDEKIDSEDINQLLQMAKEQQSIQVEAEFLQRHFQMRGEQLKGEFIEQELAEVREELRKEMGLDAILPIDKLCSVDSRFDITETIIKRLNEKYRAQQQPKKFGTITKKEATTTTKK